MEQRDQLHVLGVRASYLAAHYLGQTNAALSEEPEGSSGEVVKVPVT